MRKIYLIISFIFLMMVGCSNESLLFKGESDHWKGEYSADITDSTREDGKYIFHFKDGKQMKKNIEIDIDNDNSHTNIKEEKNDDAIITIPNACSGCSVTKDSSIIKVTIKWNGKEESFDLK